MLFSKLAEYFEKLEQTSSRLALIDILSELFSEITKEEIKEIVYLIQSRVAPFYEPIEIGMSEKLVAQALARAYGVNREEVLKEFGRIGDLGLVAKRLSSLRKQGSSKESHGSPIRSGMTVQEVFNTLKEIARMSGEGTVEKKVSTLALLLDKMDPTSAKHLVRIPLGASRLGIGDPTILDGFALAKLVDRSKRKLLEGAYN